MLKKFIVYLDGDIIKIGLGSADYKHINIKPSHVDVSAIKGGGYFTDSFFNKKIVKVFYDTSFQFHSVKSEDLLSALKNNGKEFGELIGYPLYDLCGISSLSMMDENYLIDYKITK